MGRVVNNLKMMSREQLIATYKKRRDDHNQMEEKLRESKPVAN